VNRIASAGVIARRAAPFTLPPSVTDRTIGVNVTPTACISPRASTVISFSRPICAACSSESQTLTFAIEPSGETPAYQ
jgi:hypothetical protein